MCNYTTNIKARNWLDIKNYLLGCKDDDLKQMPICTDSDNVIKRVYKLNENYYEHRDCTCYESEFDNVIKEYCEEHYPNDLPIKAQNKESMIVHRNGQIMIELNI